MDGYLKSFDGEFSPSSGGLDSLQSLKDGEYIFTIINADVEYSQNNNIPIYVLGIKAEGLRFVKHTYVLSHQFVVNMLGADLKVLGIDTDKWIAQNGRPFSREIQLVGPKLHGIRFRAIKSTEPNPEKPKYPYARLQILMRLSDGTANMSNDFFNGSAVGNETNSSNDQIPF